MASSVHTELMNVSFCWSANTSMTMCDSERESNGDSRRKRARLCLACRAEK